MDVAKQHSEHHGAHAWRTQNDAPSITGDLREDEQGSIPPPKLQQTVRELNLSVNMSAEHPLTLCF